MYELKFPLFFHFPCSFVRKLICSFPSLALACNIITFLEYNFSQNYSTSSTSVLVEKPEDEDNSRSSSSSHLVGCYSGDPIFCWSSPRETR